MGCSMEEVCLLDWLPNSLSACAVLSTIAIDTHVEVAKSAN